MDLDYQRFVTNIKKQTGLDLNQYKEAQMKRRLTSLRDKRHFKDFSSYYIEMQKDHALFNEFLERVTINVSEFFRNPKRWKVLESTIIPRLLKQNNRLKVWSAACSTGEEPYTLAIILSKLIPLSEVTIYATDIDKAILNRAKLGLYTERSLKDVPKELLKKYFEIDALGYKIKEEIKRSITFKQQNLLTDRFGRNFDLIVCRNVLIYFTEEAKEKLYDKFSKALKPSGVLFLGSTEQLLSPEKYGFVSEETFFYRKQ